MAIVTQTAIYHRTERSILRGVWNDRFFYQGGSYELKGALCLIFCLNGSFLFPVLVYTSVVSLYIVKKKYAICWMRQTTIHPCRLQNCAASLKMQSLQGLKQAGTGRKFAPGNPLTAPELYVPTCIHLFPHARAVTIRVDEHEYNFSKFYQLTISFLVPQFCTLESSKCVSSSDY